MMSSRNTRFHVVGSAALLGSLLVSALPVRSHPIDPVAPADQRLHAEIAAFRTAFAAAAAKRDVNALRRFYTDDFTHTHTSGKVDGKDARILSLLADEPTVELAAVPEFKLSCFGESVCIARALSPIKRGVDGKWFDVRWTQTYVRTRHGWQIAVSQATGLPATIRAAP